ncbi:hypothetical protein [Methanolobus sp.]|uniref:hypothetical protein n=1 Tax=Methanolobus sp. TaxID=1874737 RepID=UPI00272FDFE0|nr:hypothetical protein [Methanolobus sp.]
MPIALLLIIGALLSAFLFYSMMKSAESGSLIMVILLAIAISIVALVIGQAIKFQQFKKL